MVKDENELLGKLIKIQDQLGKVDNSKLSKITNTDNTTLDYFLKNLSEKHYIIYSMDTSTVTDLGKANHISKKKKAMSWFITLLKFAVSYTLGIFSGIIAAWLMIKLGIG